jgi:hypothetical protein
MRTAGATNLVGSEFHQSYAGAVDWNRIDYSAARAALEIGDIALFHNNEAAVTICASGDFVGDDEVAAFVFVHLG